MYNRDILARYDRTQAWDVSPITRHRGKVYTKQQALCPVYHEDTAVLQSQALPCLLLEDPKGSSTPPHPSPCQRCPPHRPSSLPSALPPLSAGELASWQPWHEAWSLLSPRSKQDGSDGLWLLTLCKTHATAAWLPLEELATAACTEEKGPYPWLGTDHQESPHGGVSSLPPKPVLSQSWQAVEGLFLP